MSYLAKLMHFCRHSCQVVLFTQNEVNCLINVKYQPCLRNMCIHSEPKKSNVPIDLPKPELDMPFLCNDNNKELIELNIRKRKGVGDIDRVHELFKALNESDAKNKLMKETELLEEALRIPNTSHPDLFSYGDQPKQLYTVNKKKEFSFKPKEFSKIVQSLNLMRTENLGVFAGHRSYYLLGDLAEMEQALIQFSVQNLIKEGFKLMAVPDILPRQVIESCGMQTKGERTQVYELDPERHMPDMMLSGTSEIALAGYLMNKEFTPKDLPVKLIAVSRCYRAETSSIAEEKGIYRVHQFTKVEMFGVCDQENSEKLLEEFRSIQEKMFSALGLHFQILDMPPPELGAPAYRKYDIEAWLPGRGVYGEISSCSNCTDYQSRRLNIKYRLPSGHIIHAHTINGTACAIPRMLIALLETYQDNDGSIHVPEVLQPFMNNKIIKKLKDKSKFKLIKTKITEENIIQESL